MDLFVTTDNSKKFEISLYYIKQLGYISTHRFLCDKVAGTSFPDILRSSWDGSQKIVRYDF